MHLKLLCLLAFLLPPSASAWAAERPHASIAAAVRKEIADGRVADAALSALDIVR